MWFRNLRLYRLSRDFSLSVEQLESQLLPHRSRPCGSLDMFTIGWVAPLGRTAEQLTHAANGRVMICARREDKVLPASVVKEFVDERVAELEEREMRKVGRREKVSIREEVFQDLLPRAFCRSSTTFAYIDPALRLLVVDAASARRAEDLVSLLRESLGSFPAVPLTPGTAPSATMTAWLQGRGVPAEIIIEDACELREPTDGGAVIRCRGEDLGSDAIGAHLSDGKQVVKLALNWRERLSCVLGEDFSIRRLRFSDVIEEQRGDIDPADEAAKFDAEFALMGLELADFIPRLLEFAGGEESAGRAEKAA